MAIGIELLVFFIHILLILNFKCSKAQRVPAMFVFGDSSVDSGNNNYLPLSLAKADFPPNGIDFPYQIPTGRFCNGKHAADIIAEKLSLPASPPYFSLLYTDHNDGSFLGGVNFASGGSGILNGTGSDLGSVVPLTTQVDYYATVYQNLVRKLGPFGAKTRLAKSLFFIVIGSNDIVSYSASSNNTLQQYVDSIILTLKGQIQRLYAYGGRKFAIPGVPLVGCTPERRLNTKTAECDEVLNSRAVKYNEGLKSMLQRLKLEIKDIYYSYVDTYRLLDSIIQNSAAYGFTEVKAACCGLGRLNGEIPCIPISTYCPNRRNHLFWDLVHPTEAADRILVDYFFNDRLQYTFPINLKQLIAV